MGRAGDRGLLRRAGAPGGGPRHRRREGRVAVAGGGDDPRAGPGRAARPQRGAPQLHHRDGGGAGVGAAAVRLRRHPADPLRRRRPLAGPLGGRGAGRRRRPRAGDEEHRAGRDGRGDQARPQRGLICLLPRVPQGGQRGPGLPPSGQGRDRSRPRGRAGTRHGRRPVPAARGRAGRDRRHQRRDDQAGVERLPRGEDLLRQRDRQRLRGGWRRRARRRPRGRPRRPDRPEVPPGRPGLGRLLLQQGRLRPQAARCELRVPLPAAQRGDRGERAAEAASHQEADQPPRLSGGKAGCAAGPRLQAPHRRHARGVQPRARRSPARRGGDCQRLRPGGDGARQGGAARGRDVRLGACGAGRRRRRGAGHRVARVRRAGLDRGGGPDGAAAAGRRPQLPRPGEALRAAGFEYEGIGRGDRPRASPAAAD